MGIKQKRINNTLQQLSKNGWRNFHMPKRKEQTELDYDGVWHDTNFAISKRRNRWKKKVNSYLRGGPR